jgi:hypothetical protein
MAGRMTLERHGMSRALEDQQALRKLYRLLEGVGSRLVDHLRRVSSFQRNEDLPQWRWQQTAGKQPGVGV